MTRGRGKGLVIDLHAAVVEHPLEIAIANRKLEVPAHRPQDHLGRGAKPRNAWAVLVMDGALGEWWREHRSYPGTLPHSTQQIRFRGCLDGMRAEPASRVLFRTSAGSQSVKLEPA
jgi:hypothetical protein